jgi:hypothetical protein
VDWNFEGDKQKQKDEQPKTFDFNSFGVQE